MLSSWLNGFESIEEIFKIEEDSPFIYRLTDEQKKEFYNILKELTED